MPKGGKRAPPPPPPSKRKDKSRKLVEVEDEVHDELDHFVDGRNKIALDIDAADGEEEAEEIDSRFDLDTPASDAVESGEGEEEEGSDNLEDDEAELERIEELQRRLPKPTSDDEESEEEGEVTGWGTSRKKYYETEEPAAEEDEEEEAKRLHKKKLATINPDEDFGDILAKTAKSGAKIPTKSAMSSKTDAAMLESMRRDLEAISYEANTGDATVESVSKNIASLSKEEKLQLLTQDSPELLKLLEDLQRYMDEVKNHVVPLLKRVRAEQLPTEKGLSYLEVKFHLLLSYCANICYYLMLKAEGKSVRNHPVIDTLLRVRGYIERIRPIDAKLKYQIDKLLKSGGAPQGSGKGEQADALRLKPNPTALGAAAEGEEEEGEEAAPAKTVYKPPKLAPAFFEDSEKAEQRKKRQLEKAGKSSIMKFIRSELTDRPEEQRTSDVYEKEDEQEKALEEFEEEHFVRIPISRKDKAQLKRRKAESNDLLNDIEDFGDLAAVDSNKTKAAHKSIAAVSKKRTARDEGDGDADVPMRHRDKFRPVEGGAGHSRGSRGGFRGQSRRSNFGRGGGVRGFKKMGGFGDNNGEGASRGRGGGRGRGGAFRGSRGRGGGGFRGRGGRGGGFRE